MIRGVQPECGFEQERMELQTVLASGIFDRAPNLALVLTYICEKYFEGETEHIKEYNVAVEALGRPVDFDPKRNSIVRVEAYRLRKRLREYYEAEGTSHSVWIDIPSGQYAPQFVRQSAPELSLSVQAQVAPASLENGDLSADQAPPAQDQHQAVGPLMTSISFGPAQPALPPASARDGYRLWITVPCLVLSLCGFLVWNVVSRGTTKVAASPEVSVIAPPSHQIRILVGLKDGTYTDRFGQVWQSDDYFQGGAVFEGAGHPILGTRDQRLYRHRREGAFSYDIPLPPGVYELRLHFAETLYGENNVAGGGETSRIFNVSANGVQILHELDVISEVGASAADTRAFKDISPADDGKLHLKFDPVTNPAIVSAIEITPGIPGKLLPIRMVSREHPYTDNLGRTWAADSYSRGGQLAVRTEPVQNIDDPELLRGERFGNLSYEIPVPPGRYGVKLYFAEAWFGPGNFAGGGIGSRLFDILCNGVAIRHGFDIFKEARGSGRAIIVPLHGLEPDPQGKITISLRPVHNYASLNALELTDESK
jgi:Malectin domain